VSWLDDIKVAVATVGGLGNWLVQMDLMLKVGISLVSFLYLAKKCVGLYRK